MSSCNLRSLALCLATSASILLAGCVSNSGTQPQKATQRASSQQSIGSIVARSQAKSGEDRNEFLLLNAEQLLDQARPGDASTLTDMVDERSLDADLKLEYAFLRAKLELSRQDGNQALFWLHDPIFQQSQLSSVDEQLLHQLRAQAFELNLDYIHAAKERIQLSSLLDGNQKQTQHDLIWQDLQRSNTSQLNQAKGDALDSLTQGWLELALIMRNQSDLAQQTSNLMDWKRAWPSHPASYLLPGELAALTDTNTELPPKVALVLPMSGQLANVSQAIQQGFMTSYYQRQQSGLNTPEVVVKDSESYPNLLSLYQDLKNQGVEFVIGPLRKEQLQQLASSNHLDIDTLGLNVLDNTSYLPDNLFEYGLTIEDEARQAANQAWQDGKRSAMLLTEPSEWAQRAASAFRQEWQSLGGSIQDEFSLDGRDSYVDVSAQWLRLNMTASQAKASNGSARHRQDIDMIFLVSKPQTARQVVPALSFNFASDIPIYATSQIYTGKPDPQHDQDLNGVYFTIMPMLLKGVSGNSAQVQDFWQQSAGNVLGFYAMGMDAFELMLRMPLMKEHQSSRFYGQTGILEMEDGVIHRQLSIARMRDGAPYPILTNQPQD
nr:penicillin-binding protein activator [Pokkaliibacter plantistimulans]